MKSITIDTPFFNEEEGLDNFFSTLKKINELLKNKIDVKYLFIDDGSLDKTKDKLIEFKNANQNLDIKIFFTKLIKDMEKLYKIVLFYQRQIF